MLLITLAESTNINYFFSCNQVRKFQLTLFFSAYNIYLEMKEIYVHAFVKSNNYV